MGPTSKDRLADSLDAINETLSHILTEQRLIRASVTKLVARLAIETDDRTEADDQLGRVQVEHERQIRRLSLVGPGE